MLTQGQPPRAILSSPVARASLCTLAGVLATLVGCVGPELNAGYGPTTAAPPPAPEAPPNTSGDPTGAPSSEGLAGSWTIVGSANPGGGGAYAGTVTIAPAGAAYALTWSLAQATYGGVAIDMGNQLAVGWAPNAGATIGVVAYRVNGGALDGVWAQAGQPGPLGVERLVGPEGLSGTYSIVEGHPPNGGSYTGTVQIVPAGQAYRLEWHIGAERYVGVGILRDGVLAVGWGTATPGVVSYAKLGAQLDGAWATYGDGQLGREVLGR